MLSYTMKKQSSNRRFIYLGNITYGEGKAVNLREKQKTSAAFAPEVPV
jgi:hypothetical protein